MAKFELNSNLRNVIRKFLEEVDLTDIDEKFKEKLESYDDDDSEDYIEFEDIKKLQLLNNKHNDHKLFVHEIITGSNLYLPKYEAPPRNPELEARIQNLKARFENEEYNKIVKNVDLNSPLRYQEAFKAKGVSTDFRTAQGQLIAIVNMVLVIAGAFVFGYKSVEYSLDKPNYLWQISAGLVLAFIVAIADLYFLFKKLLKVEMVEEGKKVKVGKKSKQKEKSN